MNNIEPIKNVWFFISEAEELYGPFANKKDTKEALGIYCDTYLDSKTPTLAQIARFEKLLLRCGTCANGNDGTCCDCAGDNFGHTTEIGSASKACENYKER